MNQKYPELVAVAFDGSKCYTSRFAYRLKKLIVLWIVIDARRHYLQPTDFTAKTNHFSLRKFNENKITTKP